MHVCYFLLSLCVSGSTPIFRKSDGIGRGKKEAEGRLEGSICHPVSKGGRYGGSAWGIKRSNNIQDNDGHIWPLKMTKNQR